MEPTEITNAINDDDDDDDDDDRRANNYYHDGGGIASTFATAQSTLGGGSVDASVDNGNLPNDDDIVAFPLVRPNEIAIYIQRPSLRFDDVLYFLTNVEPARFNFPKPPGLRLSDDAWAALQLRVDHAARDILDPHRYYVAASCVSVLITIVFYAIRPGYDRRSIHANSDRGGMNGNGDDDDEIYDDYFEDDLWERKHALDDVVVAELDYLNSNLDRHMWIWRTGLLLSVVLLFGSVLFISMLMERRNTRIDDDIIRAVEEIRHRFADEGLGVEYRTNSSRGGGYGGSSSVLFRRYMRPTRVVVFYYLNNDIRDRGGGSTTIDAAANNAHRRVGSFFSDDYQRRYFPPIPTMAAAAAAADLADVTNASRAIRSSSFSIR